MPDDRPGLRPAALRHVMGRWLARVAGQSRRLRVRPSIPHVARPFGGRWKGRLERFGTQATLRLALRWRPTIHVSIAGAGSPRLTSYLVQNFHHHQRVVRAASLAANSREPQPDHPLPQQDAKVAPASRRTTNVLVTRRELRHLHTSRVTEARRMQVVEHDRLETRIAATTRLDEVAAPMRRAGTSVEAPHMVLRSVPRPEPNAKEKRRDHRIVEEPSRARSAATVTATPKVELDIERLADQVLWRIERRVIAQRERMGKA